MNSENMKNFAKSRLSWSTLLLCIVAFEGAALYFQHGMGLSPCVMCIYERICMMVVAFGAMIGMLKPRKALVRLFGYALWVGGSAKGVQLSVSHSNMQLNPSPFDNCPIKVDYPSYLPLDEWVPHFFKASGNCSEVVWRFLNLSMPQWLVIIFSLMTLASLCFLLAELNSSKAQS